MHHKFFSIIVVALNPKEGLQKTLDSIVNQTFQDYEIIVKDGGSTDGSLEKLEKSGYFAKYPSIQVVRQKDKGIYDAMNQAVKLAVGDYVQFLNCGDLFYDEKVLEQVASCIKDHEKSFEQISSAVKQKEMITASEIENDMKTERTASCKIFYGNQYNQLQNAIIYSAPAINDFTCYRNVPCHQVCFYDRRLFEKRAYKTQYKVRADYEHFLYSIYEEKAKGIFLPVIVASYEGGGFSETKENRKCSAKEHKEITGKYLGKKKVLKYRMIMWLTLAPIRTKIAESPALSGIYNGIKTTIYKVLKK